MIWILLLYVLPFLICCILGYKMSKELGETKGDYLVGVLILMIPLGNILFLIFLTLRFLEESKTIKSIKEYLKQPL